MPAGVTWGKYITFLGASLLSMFIGAQVVHSVYRPLDDLEELIKIELEKQSKNMSQEEPPRNV